MRFTAAERRAKLSKLMEIEGYDNFEEMAQAILSDSVSPAICMNEDCNFTCEMEPRRVTPSATNPPPWLNHAPGDYLTL